MTTKITPSVLENTAVVAATHGAAATVPVIVVDPQGRITGVTNTSISIGTSQITSGTLADDRLPSSGVSATTYGTASNVSKVTVDAKGRITAASNVAIQIATSQITGYPSFASSATTDTTNAANITTGTLPSARLPDSGAAASTYGTASSVSQVVVDAKGRITGASNVAIAIASGAVSGLATSATTDTTNADNITTGTLPSARLPDSGVVAGTNYGSASAVPVFNVDAKGRITSVTSTAISLSSGSVSGLASVATSGRYDALLANSGQPTIPTSLPASDVSSWAKAATKPSYAYSEITSLPTIPTNTNQLTNGAGFVTSADAAAATPATTGVGAILALFWASFAGNSPLAATKVFPGGTLPGSQLYYCPFYGDADIGYSHWRLSGSNFQTFYTVHDSESTLVMPWTDPRGVTYVSGTWRLLSGSAMSAYGGSGTVSNHNTLWQRIS